MEQNNIKANPRLNRLAFLDRWLTLSLLAVVLIIGVYYAWRVWSARAATATEIQVETISTAALEERYGLRVRLIGVTAAGGMVDFRLKILDAEKAKQILSDPEKMPSLIVPENGTTLAAPQTEKQNQDFIDGGVYFILFSNAGGAVKPGTPVVVSFGEFQLEPLNAQ